MLDNLSEFKETERVLIQLEPGVSLHTRLLFILSQQLPLLSKTPLLLAVFFVG